jgi:hypothetical protein
LIPGDFILSEEDVLCYENKKTFLGKEYRRTGNKSTRIY